MKVTTRQDKRPYSTIRVDQSDKFTGKTYGRGEVARIPQSAIIDHAGREAMISTFGDLITANRVVDISAAFQYFVDPDKVITTVTGTGAASVDTSRLKLTTGANGSCEVRSRVPIVYRPGFSAFANFTCAFGPYVAGSTQEAGVFDSDNGYSLTLTAENKLAVVHRRGGAVISTVTQGSFAMDQLDGTGESGFTVNPQYMNIFRIEYGYLGVATATFEIYGGQFLGWIPFHIIEVINTGSGLIINDPHVPITFKVSGANDAQLLSGSWLGGSIGSVRDHSQNSQFAADVSKSALTGTVTLISIRVKSTFKGRASKYPCDLHEVTAGLTANKPNFIRLIYNGTIAGANWVDVHTDSVMEYDITGSVSGGRMIRSWSVEQVGTLNQIIESGEVRMVAGDIITAVLVTAGTNVDANAALHWDELR